MQAKPRAYEPRRLVATLRGHTRVLFVVSLLALFGGAGVARWLVPDHFVARARARIAFEPHRVLARANEEAVFNAAASRVGVQEALAELRERVEVAFQGRDQLSVQVRGAEAEPTRALAQALVEGYVALANQRGGAQDEPAASTRTAERAQAEAARDRAQEELAAARASDAEQVRLRAQQDELAAVLHALESEPAPASAPVARQELLEAQRTLSRLLAQNGTEAQVKAQRERIARLQRREERGSSAQASRVEALKARLHATHAELARRSEADAQHQARAAEALAQAQARLAALPPGAEAGGLLRSSVTVAARAEPLSRRALRVLVSLLAPLIALALLLAAVLARELRGWRVCEPTEVAHWLAAPVLTSSSWPRRQESLEALVDALEDDALASLGTTLVLPLSELERPLAHTLTAQLNARAQRYFRSQTGSRITIAQDWQGELGSSRIARAAEIADRVLWVVAADAHPGAVLAAQRTLIKRDYGVAAVLVDAEPSSARSVGAGRAFWDARPPNAAAQAAPAQLSTDLP